MKLTEKEFKDYLKLTFSSLFARRMPIVVFGCPGTTDNQFFASNITLEEIELYEPKTMYYIHKVSLKHKDFLSDFLETFPLLKDSVIIMDTRPFMAFLNKQKSYAGLKLIKTTDNQLILEILPEGGIPAISPIVGQVISEHHAFMYRDLFESGKVTSEEPHVRDIVNDSFILKDLCPLPLLTIYNRSFSSLQHVWKATAPVQEGMSFVALKEFTKNYKDPEQILYCLSGAINRAAKLEFMFRSNFVIVESVQPAARWFCN